jgi:hypothetical protein
MKTRHRTSRLVEEAVEGAPVVVREPEGDEGLGDGAPREGEELPEDEGLGSEERTFLAEGRAVLAQQVQ